MWRLCKREVRPPHVRHTLQTRGASLGKQAHFDALLARFDESEEDVPLALRPGRGRRGGGGRP